jgi:NitT/TauT family transport system substrate-binding protein
MRPMRRTLCTLLTATALLAAAACGGGSGSPSGSSAGGVRTIKVGAIAIADTAPVHLAVSKGIFKKHGLNAKITAVQGGAAGISGVMGGQFDFAFANTTSILTAAARNLPIKVVSNGNSSTGVPGKDFSAVVVRKDSPMKSAKDLEGKTIAVNQLKNIGDTTIRAAVRKAGGDPSKPKFVEMPFPDMPAALAKGRVDAVWIVEPFLTQVTGSGGRAVVWNFAEAAPDLTVAMYFTSSKLAQQDPDLVKRFTAAINEAFAYATAHPDAARKELLTYTQIPAATVGKITLSKWPIAINRASVETIADDALKDGVLPKKPDLDALLP